MTADEHTNNINWSGLCTASGNASGVPEAMLGLISPAEEIRKQSYWRLDNEVVLQSDLYEAAYFVIPVLIQMPQRKPEHGREEIYDLLYEIANGYAPETIVCRGSSDRIIPLKQRCIEEIKKCIPSFNSNILGQDTQLSLKPKELIELIDDNNHETHAS